MNVKEEVGDEIGMSYYTEKNSKSSEEVDLTKEGSGPYERRDCAEVDYLWVRGSF